MFEGGAGAGILARAAASIAKPVLGLFQRRHKVADAELAALRDKLDRIVNDVEASSVQAQMAVRASPNEPEAKIAMLKSIELATSVGQKLASVFEIYSGAPGNVDVVAARTSYREIVADEDILHIVDPGLREAKCAEIERVCSLLCSSISKAAWKRWGQGVGSRSGQIQGRRLPK